MPADKPVDSFKIPVSALSQDPSINDAHEEFTKTRQAFIDAKKAFDNATEALHDLLGPLLPAQRLAKGKHWKLKEDADGDGLVIQIFADEPKRGKSKPELPVEHLSLPPTAKVANARNPR